MSHIGELFDAIHSLLPSEAGAVLALADTALVLAVLAWAGLACSDGTGMQQQHLDGEYKWFMQVYGDGQ
jgi:hypothetical protein